MKRIIIDCDPGTGIPGSAIDDGFAVALALLHPEIKVEGITLVAGNVSLDDGIRSIIALSEAAGIVGKIPLIAGASQPIVYNAEPIREAKRIAWQSPKIQELWKDVEAPVFKEGIISNERASDFIVRTVMESPGEITLVAVGPQTNIATALLVEPKLAQAVERIIVMAGNIIAPGIINPVQELNAVYDPEALEVVLRSGAPITLRQDLSGRRSLGSMETS